MSNLLNASGDNVRTSVEVHFEKLGEDDTSRVNYKQTVCDYIREEFQKEDSLNDLLTEYKNLKQGVPYRGGPAPLRKSGSSPRPNLAVNLGRRNILT
eukprot:SAG11_NODE_23563_length_386_cov_1.386760_1_plen_96_part_10